MTTFSTSLTKPTVLLPQSLDSSCYVSRRTLARPPLRLQKHTDLREVLILTHDRTSGLTRGFNSISGNFKPYVKNCVFLNLRSLCNSVGIVTGMRDGQLRIRGSISNNGKRRFYIEKGTGLKRFRHDLITHLSLMLSLRMSGATWIYPSLHACIEYIRPYTPALNIPVPTRLHWIYPSLHACIEYTGWLYLYSCLLKLDISVIIKTLQKFNFWFLKTQSIYNSFAVLHCLPFTSYFLPYLPVYCVFRCLILLLHHSFASLSHLFRVFLFFFFLPAIRSIFAYTICYLPCVIHVMSTLIT
jgi:hypothetical protein